MATFYSKERLAYALKVFRESRKDTAPAAEKVQRHLRNDYQFRRVGAPSNLHNAVTWDDDDASSDEYNPGSEKKRRPVNPRPPKPRRTKQGPVPANPTHTTAEIFEAEIGHLPSLVTLKLRSARGRNLLKDFAGQGGTGYETKDSDEDNVSSAGARQPGMTYLEKQNEESGKIGQGTTRSGLRRKMKEVAKNQGCTACKQANKRCSMKTSGHLPCKRCENEDLRCVEYSESEAMKEAEETRLREALASALTPPNSQSTASLSPVGERPIDELRRHFVDVQIIRGEVFQPGTSRHNPIFLASRSPTPEPPKPKMPPTFMISTAWAHPIDFKSKATECHFCLDFRYGIYGHGLIRVEVSRMANELLQEVSDGHHSRGKAATRMCVMCSLKRLYIMRCRIHVVTQFRTVEVAGMRRYNQQLLDRPFAVGPATKQGVYDTCSLCVHAASWHCVADQSRDKLRCGLTEEQGKGIGCGLLLCASCAGQVQADNGVVKQTTVQKVNGQRCRRADMEFLFPGSLLHKTLK